MSEYCGQYLSWKLSTAQSRQSVGRLVIRSKIPGSARRSMLEVVEVITTVESRAVSIVALAVGADVVVAGEVD